MPILPSSKKALRRDKRRTIVNIKTRDTMKLAIKTARATTTKKTVSAAYQAIDRAAKKNLLHRNKAARLKSQLAKLLKKPKKSRKTLSQSKGKKATKPTKTSTSKKRPSPSKKKS